MSGPDIVTGRIGCLCAGEFELYVGARTLTILNLSPSAPEPFDACAQYSKFWRHANPHFDDLSACVVRNKDKKLFTAARDGGIQMWDVTNPVSPMQCQVWFMAHEKSVSSLALTETLYSASEDGTVHMWHVPTSSTIDDRQPSDGVFHSASKVAILKMVVEFLVIIVQLLSYPFGDNFPWGEAADPVTHTVPLFKVTFTMPRAIYEIIYWILLLLAVLFCWFFGADQIFADNLAFMIRQDKNMERNGPVHGMDVPQFKRLLKMTKLKHKLCRGILFLGKGVLFIPTITKLVESLDCTWSESIRRWSVYPEVSCTEVYHTIRWIIGLFVAVIYVPCVMRLQAAGGNPDALRADYHRGFTTNSATVGRVLHLATQHLFRSWYSTRPRSSAIPPFLDKTLDVRRITWAGVVDQFVSLTLIIVLIIFSKHLSAVAGVYVVTLLILWVSVLILVPYHHSSLNGVLLGARSVVLLSGIMCVVVVVINDTKVQWPVYVWVVCTPVVFLLGLVGSVCWHKRRR